jgi:hypothetical protein
MSASPFITSASADRDETTSAPGAGLLHPIPLMAIAVLVVNDHALKPAFGNALTGKLSDAAGLVFFPLFLQALVELAQSAARASWRPSRAVIAACAVLTAVTFAATNLAEPAAELYRHGLGLLQWPFRAVAAGAAGAGVPGPTPVQHTLDPTDLLALPFAGLALWLGWRRVETPR